MGSAIGLMRMAGTLLAESWTADAAASLAVAEHLRLSGEEFLTALILGDEISCRTSNMIAKPPAKSHLGLYMTSIAAGIGSAVAASKLMKLSGRETVWAIGIAVSQVVPMPSNSVVPVVRDFLQAWRAAPSTIEPSHLALEGYINARTFVEALKRAGRNLTRKAFLDSAWSIRRLDLGGFELNFQQPGRNASRFVELTMIGRAGRFIR